MGIRDSLQPQHSGNASKLSLHCPSAYVRTYGPLGQRSKAIPCEQLRRAMAWVFTRYVPMGSSYYELETYARLRQDTGLWADAYSVAPWEWRAAHRPAPNPKLPPR